MQQRFLELLTIPFGVGGESRLLHVSGQYFEIIDAPSPVDVLLLDANGAQRGIMRGAEASFHLKNTDFSTIQITSATAQTIRIGYGSGEAGTRRTAGIVEVIDSTIIKTLAGFSYALVNNAAAVAAQYSYVQAWNPVGSGKRVRVDRISAACSVTGGLTAFISATQMALAGSQVNAHNKLAGAADGVTLGRRENAAADYALTGKVQMFTETTAGIPANVSLNYPVILLPGYGLTIRPSNQNVAINMWLELVEENL